MCGVLSRVTDINNVCFVILIFFVILILLFYIVVFKTKKKDFKVQYVSFVI